MTRTLYQQTLANVKCLHVVNLQDTDAPHTRSQLAPITKPTMIFAMIANVLNIVRKKISSLSYTVHVRVVKGKVFLHRWNCNHFNLLYTQIPLLWFYSVYGCLKYKWKFCLPNFCKITHALHPLHGHWSLSFYGPNGQSMGGGLEWRKLYTNPHQNPMGSPSPWAPLYSPLGSDSRSKKSSSLIFSIQPPTPTNSVISLDPSRYLWYTYEYMCIIVSSCYEETF